MSIASHSGKPWLRAGAGLAVSSIAVFDVNPGHGVGGSIQLAQNSGVLDRFTLLRGSRSTKGDDCATFRHARRQRSRPQTRRLYGSILGTRLNSERRNPLIGPCPPGSERHRYVWTIKVLGPDGEVLASSTVQDYPRRDDRRLFETKPHLEKELAEMVQFQKFAEI